MLTILIVNITDLPHEDLSMTFHFEVIKRRGIERYLGKFFCFVFFFLRKEQIEWQSVYLTVAVPKELSLVIKKHGN